MPTSIQLFRRHGLRGTAPALLLLLYPSLNLIRVEIQREFDRAFARLLERGDVDDICAEYIGAPYSSFSTSQ